ncbi:flagellar hook-associated protein FlgK [Thermodesulforhabdus norvegica]|uniref:Flagellar hook-associated protein 1 n=1 Tax=Thermodesulforhabdus norvegica TaxID=39841 RepID=A0A1I4R466_9BACT|nr:flagellar hook-associated protein FlgK [Thermodesulforhabdus norvegica]SFM47104.1 Flagellar basal body rod FlgEFG protein C-terminal [Thermodesulforhabdus norvegica]
MGGLIQALETAKLSLLNTQLQIQTANNNISQAENENYHRQTVELVTNPPVRYGHHFIGTGARVYRIRQEIDRFVEQRLFNAISGESDFATRSFYLDTLSTYAFDDGESGVSSLLRNFWDAWDDLSANPGEAEKVSVVKAAESLADFIRSTYQSMAEVAGDIDKDLEQTVDRANELIQKITEYNSQIVRTEYPLDPGNSEIRDTANSLRDLRYEAIKELASLIPISVQEQENGSVVVSVTDNVGDPPVLQEIPLIYGNTGTDFTTLVYDGNGEFHYNGYAQSPSHSLDGGKINGLLTSYDDLNTVMDEFNRFAVSLIDEVNSRHADVFSGTGADDIQVSTTFDPDPTLALYVSNLQDTNIASLGDFTFAEYLSQIQHNIGSLHESAEDRHSFYSALVDEVQEQQQSISGVSLDEELVDLIKFQQLFQASAKVITTVSELMNTVVNMV